MNTPGSITASRCAGTALPISPHPIHVAQIVAEMRLDSESIIAALLHDCIEDTDTTYEDVAKIFGVTVAERIRNQFVALFDPASEPLSEEVLAVNDYIQEQAGYSLYDAQLAVTEAVKRQLQRGKVGQIVAECGSGKSVTRSQLKRLGAKREMGARRCILISRNL